MSLAAYSLEALAAYCTGARLRLPPTAGVVDEYVYDTRNLFEPARTLFIALRGERRDGHAFIQEAYARGVRHFLVQDAALVPADAAALIVPDTQRALQEIAAGHRNRFHCPILGITGSNGKTIVKEWIASLLSPQVQLVKSPKSYNSQIGVPLSLLELHAGAEMGVFEAGISRPGEMARLAQMIRPDRGVFTHLGDAHAEGFADDAEKLAEKLLLFRTCDRVFCACTQTAAVAALRAAGHQVLTSGTAADADLRISDLHRLAGGWEFQVHYRGAAFPAQVLQPGEAALDNALLALHVALDAGASPADLLPRLRSLNAVSMRMELISDNPDLTILNDAYNADRASILNAFSLLASASSHPHKRLILTDLEHQGREQAAVQREVLGIAVQQFGAENIQLVGPVFAALAAEFPGVRAWPDTESLLRHYQHDDFRGAVVLLKGARAFELERILPYLSQRAVATWLRVNLNALVQNYHAFRRQVPPGTRLMAMVKAFSYGSGSWEIAQALALEGVDYLAVAYTSEGIALRTRGIRTPVLVMNADHTGMEQLFHFGLEPEVFHLDFLRQYVRLGQQLNLSRMPVHLKLDTGMRRLGFVEADLPALRDFLREHPEVEVISVFSHLAASEDRDFAEQTHGQAALFERMYAALDFPADRRPLRHILNSGGILNYPEYAWDMVRLGIGLYGVSPDPAFQAQLREIGTLVTVISQIHHYPAGTAIGYGFSEVVQRETRVATVPAGYADGIRRSLGNGKMAFLVRGKRAPVLGRVCMDMLMLDVTDIPEAQEGDEVVLIGRQGAGEITVQELAEKCGTISYEILTGISQRVRRVYVRE